MKFTKMQGCGNDYVYVNCFEEKVDDPSALSIRVSDRHFGIGSDGLILILPSKVADCEMDMYNADGSRGKMCGNGIRCVAKYVYEHGIVPKTRMTVATQSGIKVLDLTIEDGKTKSVRVDMGPAELTASRVPVQSDTEKAIDVPIILDGKEYRFTAVSMGNPHAVVFMDDVENLKIEEIGPKFENNPIFPERVNTEFIKVLGEDTIQMRVWERGSGETLACGTGACGAVVASIVNGKVRGDVPITVKLRGGDLKIEWNRKDNHVYMTGPAATVFTGEITV
ncbi:MAG: diaminopimelate epimerase [Bilifractor sp.]